MGDVELDLILSPAVELDLTLDAPIEMPVSLAPDVYIDLDIVARGEDGTPGVGVPTGGTVGQVLAKASDDDYDTEWVEQTGGGAGVTDHGDLTGLTDDDHPQYALADGSRGAFATTEQGSLADSAVQPDDLATVATTGAYSDLSGTPSIPDELTDLDTTVTGSQLNSMKSKLDGIEAGAEVNEIGAADIANFETSTELDARDTANRDRANHTGTQAISTVSGLQDALDAKAASSSLATVATSGDYNDLSNTPTIPTKVSDLTNDTGYITDYTVTEGDVTAHEAALSITESQISDLGNYLESVDIADINATGTADDTTYLRGDGSWATPAGGGGGGVTDHGALTGLSDDDHTQYALADGSRGSFATTAQGALADSAVQPGDLATVATTGAYSDLSGTPSIPSDFDDLTDGTTNKAFTATLKMKLDGIEAGADVTDATNVASAGAFMKSSDDLDDISEGSTNKHFTSAEKIKLSGIATGATANDTDSNLKNRANHTGTQAISTVSGLQDELDDKLSTTTGGTVSGNIELDKGRVADEQAAPAFKTSRTFSASAGDLFDAEVTSVMRVGQQATSAQNPPGYNLAEWVLIENGDQTYAQGESSHIKLYSNRTLFNRRVEVNMGGGGRAILASGRESNQQRLMLSIHNTANPQLRLYGPDDPEMQNTFRVMQSLVYIESHNNEPLKAVRTDTNGKEMRLEFAQFSAGHQALRAFHDNVEIGRVRFEPTDGSITLENMTKLKVSGNLEVTGSLIGGVKKYVDANGWTVYDYGTWKEWQKTVAGPTAGIAANGQSSPSTSFGAYPVGLSHSDITNNNVSGHISLDSDGGSWYDLNAVQTFAPDAPYARIVNKHPSSSRTPGNPRLTMTLREL